jgi:ABC-2 type transport system permease protein
MNRTSSPLMLLLRVNLLTAWRRMLALQNQSRLLVAVISAFLVGYLFLSFKLFHFGLRFIGRFPGLGSLLVERLIYLLFAFLFFLLLLSSLVIAYTNLFRNRETAFLLPLPLPIGTVFTWKLIESTLLASWAFVFLVAPLLAAYGLVHQVPWHFYPFTLGMIALFIVIPGIGGSAGAILLARHLDRKAFQLAALGTVLGLVAIVALRFQPEPVTEELLEARAQAVVDRLLINTGFAQSPLLPSYWLSAGVENWAEGALPAAGFFALVLLSHSLFLARIGTLHLGQPFREAGSRVEGRGSAFANWNWFRRAEARQAVLATELREHWRLGLAAGPGSKPLRSAAWGHPDRMDQILRRMGLRPDARAIVTKDLRVFWRDTTQWGQTVLLFGLLTVYIINLRHFTRQLDSTFWISLVSYLNLGACALNVATITTRFIFPQFSLEGRRVWLVGMAPLGLARAVRIKFWLASFAALALTLSLTVLSGHLLRLGALRITYFALATTVMTFTLNGIAVGLGVLYPNFRESNPSKIVSGFGGTFCLVLSFLYILVSVVTLAIGSPWGWRDDSPEPGRAAFAWSIFLLLSLLAGAVPLRLGLRRAATVEL